MKKINIDGCYIALIYRLTQDKAVDYYKRKLEMINFSIITKNNLDKYYTDLITGDTIYNNEMLFGKIGSLYVKDNMIPISQIIDVKTGSMKKSKLLKLLAEPLIELNTALYNKKINPEIGTVKYIKK